MTPFLFRHAAWCLLLVPTGIVAQSSLPKQSPFSTPGEAPAVAAASETLEFAGVSSVGKRTDVIIHDKASKRKHWIAIGETVEGISVVKYDPQHEQAVVRVNGAEKILALRKPTRVAQGPAPVAAIPTGFNVQTAPAVQMATPAVAAAPAPVPAPAPTPPPPAVTAPPQTPEAQAKAETEARMLVSDLLEIGMAQRKAYEEAQRKAAGSGAEPAPPTQPPANAPSQPPAQSSQPPAAQPSGPGGE